MGHRRAPRWVVAVGLAAGLQAASPARAFHTIFHFTVDRFEVDGNAAGPFDGTPDLIDEFDGGDFAARWRILFGTAYERDGLLHLTNPGTHYNPGFPLDLSGVATQTAFTAGGGSFTAQSTWPSLVVPSDNLIHMSIWFSAEGDAEPWETFGIDVSNFAPAGLVISQHLIRLDHGVWSVPQVVDVPLDPATITGPLVFRTTVDDETKLAQASFSLDGGATFQSPFPPTAVFEDTTIARVLLGADPHAAPLPPTTTTTTTLPGCQATPFRVRRASIDLDFARKTRDAISLTGTLPLAPGVVAAGQTVTVDVAGVQRTFQLDATGRGRIGRDRIRVGRGSRAPFVMELRRGAFAPALADEGLTPGRIRSEVRTLPLRVDLGSSCFGKAQFFLYSATRTGRGHAESI
jgi:hypothetical protein